MVLWELLMIVRVKVWFPLPKINRMNSYFNYQYAFNTKTRILKVFGDKKMSPISKYVCLIGIINPKKTYIFMMQVQPNDPLIIKAKEYLNMMVTTSYWCVKSKNGFAARFIYVIQLLGKGNDWWPMICSWICYIWVIKLLDSVFSDFLLKYPFQSIRLWI